MSILQGISDALSSLISMIGDFVLALLPLAPSPEEKVGVITGGELSGIFPLVAISVAISIVFLSVKIIKKVSWGY